jgi:hypothetical protein
MPSIPANFKENKKWLIESPIDKYIKCKVIGDSI